MSSLLDQSVTEADDGSGHDFACPVTQPDCLFTSKGWPKREHALARGQQHFDEHKGIAITPSLEEFRAEHGLVALPDGTCVTAADL